MSDLISRQKAIQALQELDMLKESRWFPEVNQSPMNFVERMFIEAENSINSLPSAEPERKTGKWKYPRKFGHTHLMGKCSVCGKYESAEWIVLDKPNFCPHCGADMRGDR